jgi:hypothetical protein
MSHVFVLGVEPTAGSLTSQLAGRSERPLANPAIGQA